MKKDMINKLFTEKVNQFINDGYVINYSSMAGHQGEEGKVDLVKEEKLIRIWINRESSHDWNNPNTFYGYQTILRVSLWKRPARESNNSTVWMSELDTIEENIFYELSSNWYTDNLEEALRAQEVHNDRSLIKWQMNNTSQTSLTDDASKKIAREYLKRKHGYKRVSWDKLAIVKETHSDNIRYRVRYNNTNYEMMK